MLQEKLIDAHLDILSKHTHLLLSPVLILLACLVKQASHGFFIHVVFCKQGAEVADLRPSVVLELINLIPKLLLRLSYLVVHLLDALLHELGLLVLTLLKIVEHFLDLHTVALVLVLDHVVRHA